MLKHGLIRGMFEMPPDPLVFLMLLAISVVSAIGIVFWAHRYASQACARLLRGRPILSDDELISLFHHGQTETCDPRLLTLLQLVGESLEVDYHRLRPADLMRELLQESWVDYHYHAESLLAELERFVGGKLVFHLPEDPSLAELIASVLRQSRS